MGSYASFEDIHHPTTAGPLAEFCTACRNEGWVKYPISVGVHVEELDPCPYGCTDKDDLMDMYPDDMTVQQSLQYQALLPEEYEALEDEYETLWRQDAARTEAAPDPFLTLSQQMKLQGVKHLQVHEPVRVQGTVSSDDYVQGYMRDGRYVHHVSVPPYAVGTLIEMDEWYADIRYEFMGSTVDVFVKVHTLYHDMRFAHNWDRDYSTHSMMERWG